MSVSWLDHPSAVDPAFAASSTQTDRRLKAPFGREGFSFKDFLDILNPLNHIPVIGSLFRSATDQTINPGARLIGGALYGGPVGFAVAAINTAVEAESGADIGGHLIAALSPASPQAPTSPAAAEVARVLPPQGVQHYADAARLARANDPFNYVNRGLA
jgi:hypothetical protein